MNKVIYNKLKVVILFIFSLIPIIIVNYYPTHWISATLVLLFIILPVYILGLLAMFGFYMAKKPKLFYYTQIVKVIILFVILFWFVLTR